MTGFHKRKDTPPPLQPPRDEDLTRLRSSSPAIKRPASVMGAQDREEHSNDAEMADATPSFVITPETQLPSEIKKQDTGKTHGDRNTNAPQVRQPGVPESSQPGAVQQSTSLDANAIAPTPFSYSTIAIPPTCTDLPSYDEQTSQITQILEREKIEGQKGYLVSTRWWNRILVRGTHPPGSIDKDAAEGEVGAIDNTGLAMVTEDSGKLLDLAGEKFVVLRPGVRYTEDYLIVPQEGWDLLVSWYGVATDSPVITRYCYDITSEVDIMPNIDYETEPPIFTFLKVPSEHTQQTQKEASDPPPKMVASKYMPANEWLKAAKRLVKVNVKTKVRVWRILGGLKSHAPSGLPSPAASRSSSPAPGTEIVATIPDKMLLDVNTFAALPTGEHRDDLGMEDNTANEKYNGKSALLMYVGKSDLIAIEEQKKTGEWPSDTSRLALPKNAKDKAKGLTPSGRTSPAPGMTTRSRGRREVRARGNVGLTNLGNTCYMNSALQSIRSVRELTEYFLHGEWSHELNKSNPLGHGGAIARAYAHLIKGIFEERGQAFGPREFKTTVGRFSPSFSGYGQQDSQEFLLFLLDGLSEDLNRISKKPYIEKPDSTDEMVHDHQALQEFADRNWADYKARNDSIITDLFAGMYKSTLTCPVCDKVSIIFDPFNNLTLQLPIESTWSKECFFLPLYGPPKRIDVEVDKNASISAIKEFVSKRVGSSPDRLIMAEAYKSKFYKIFDNTLVVSEAGINLNSDVIFFFELEDVPTNYNPNKRQRYNSFSVTTESDEVVDATSSKADKLLVPLFHRHTKNALDNKRSTQRPFFGYGSYIVLNREENKSYHAIMRKIVAKVASMTSRKILDEVEDDSSDAVTINDDSSRSGTHSNEDGFIDVSMRDASVLPDVDAGSIDRFVNTQALLPKALAHLFEASVTSTGEGIPTGWNNISEHDDFTPLQSRVPKTSRRSLPSSEESGESAGDESAVSDADTERLEEDPLPSTADLDTAAMFNNFKGANREKRAKRVYSRKGKKFQGKRVERTRIEQQPTPVDDDFDLLVRPGEAIVCDWNTDTYDALFGGDLNTQSEGDERGLPTWRGEMPVIEDVVLKEKRQIRARRKREGVSLEDCLNEFGKAETLSEQNSWYCPRCKEHRRAEKKFELWKVPDILIMHLKRFSSQRNLRDKLDLNVDYPVEGLDLSQYVQDQEGKCLIYDLIAVDNHYGGLGGGHYTAFAKNFNNSEWYDFNDGHVSKRGPEQVVTSSAYILFYRRRDEYPLGGPRLQEILEDRDSDASSTHDTGNGRRLGDSSQPQAGSSGLGEVEAAHHLGDGGLEGRSHDQSVDNEHQATMIDEGVGEDVYGPQPPQIWDDSPGWGFNVLNNHQHNTSVNDDADMQSDYAGSVDSTRVEGTDAPSVAGDMDVPMYSDAPMNFDDIGDMDQDTSMRSVRESAPPPDYEVAVGGSRLPGIDDGEDEDDEPLPVVELKPDETGELGFSFTSH